MAASNNLLTFFTTINNEGGVVVKDAPKLDLDLYIQNYKGYTRFDRLLHVGRTSVPLCVDALKAAIIEAKKGKDQFRYRCAWECIRTAAPSEPEAQLDRAWLERTELSNKQETQRLEAELKGYKNNLVRESIRMGNEDLGKHLESIGDLGGAAEAYTRMRPDVSHPRHIAEVGKHLISVSLQRREWALVLSNLSKIMGVSSTEEETSIQPYAKITFGIALMGQEKYLDAASSFLHTDSSIPSSAYSEVASANDVANYGGLLALATMDRNELQSRVLDNQNFRTFLELEPHIRRAITQFVSGRYAACLAILESYRPDYLLDIYLQRHVNTIYSQIRSKCIVQYLIPFSCVTFDSMNATFGGPGKNVEEELCTMIRSGLLQARMNTIDKLITTTATNQRAKMQASALEAARDFEKQALERIRRMSVVAAELEVRNKPTKGGSHQANMQGITEAWYDDVR